MTTIVADPHALSMLRLQLEIAVDALTRGEACRVERDDRPQTVTLAPLLVQVAEAVQDNSGPAAGFVARSKPPLRVDAVDLLRDVDRAVLRRSDENRLNAVRGWAGNAHALVELVPLEEAVEHAEGWARRARALLDPAPPWRLRGVACPECGAESVTVLDGSGEDVQRAPIEVDRVAGVARCVAPDCGARWAPHAWDHLAGLIAAQTEVETLAHDPDVQ